MVGTLEGEGEEDHRQQDPQLGPQPKIVDSSLLQYVSFDPSSCSASLLQPLEYRDMDYRGWSRASPAPTADFSDPGVAHIVALELSYLRRALGRCPMVLSYRHPPAPERGAKRTSPKSYEAWWQLVADGRLDCFRRALVDAGIPASQLTFHHESGPEADHFFEFRVAEPESVSIEEGTSGGVSLLPEPAAEALPMQSPAPEPLPGAKAKEFPNMELDTQLFHLSKELSNGDLEAAFKKADAATGNACGFVTASKFKVAFEKLGYLPMQSQELFRRLCLLASSQKRGELRWQDWCMGFEEAISAVVVQGIGRLTRLAYDPINGRVFPLAEVQFVDLHDHSATSSRGLKYSPEIQPELAQPEEVRRMLLELKTVLTATKSSHVTVVRCYPSRPGMSVHDLQSRRLLAEGEAELVRQMLCGLGAAAGATSCRVHAWEPGDFPTYFEVPPV